MSVWFALQVHLSKSFSPMSASFPRCAARCTGSFELQMPSAMLMRCGPLRTCGAHAGDGGDAEGH